MKTYIFFNPLAGKGNQQEKIESVFTENKSELLYFDLTAKSEPSEILCDIAEDDKIVICGGDGTLNRFINSLGEMEIKNDIFYLATGTGNDFLNDLGLKGEKGLVKINDYIENLPVLKVDGKEYRFVNGVGFGLDGYACAECDRVRREKNKKGNYVAFAFKGIVHSYSPVNAKVTVDGKQYNYEKVWLASCMKGRFFGAGIRIAPNQDRNAVDGKVSSVIAHSLSRFRIITVFPSIFKGTHIKYKKYVALMTGHEITVEFDRPIALQIDGENVCEATSYSVSAAKTPVKEQVVS